LESLDYFDKLSEQRERERERERERGEKIKSFFLILNIMPLYNGIDVIDHSLSCFYKKNLKVLL
jgi:hypothetical protein